MVFDPDRHHRQSLRLKGFDYSQSGAYAVTICTGDRLCLFGDATEGGVQRNEYGEIVAGCWLALAGHFPTVPLDTWVVMPHHVHGILVLGQPVSPLGPAPGGVPSPGCPCETWTAEAQEAPARPAHPLASPMGPRPRSVASMVGSFKSAAARQINARRGTPGAPVWQRSYYEHVIRDQGSLQRIRQYIVDNPGCWATDRENLGKIVAPGRAPG
ncbi:MAG: transposase [Thermodesulfobacteriota bacterium]